MPNDPLRDILVHVGGLDQLEDFPHRALAHLHVRGKIAGEPDRVGQRMRKAAAAFPHARPFAPRPPPTPARRIVHKLIDEGWIEVTGNLNGGGRAGLAAVALQPEDRKASAELHALCGEVFGTHQAGSKSA